VKKIREKKSERTKKVKEEERGCIAVCSLKKFSLHIQILGDLYISNIISFEHIKPLGFQYRSLPCLATYSSTQKLKSGHSTCNPCNLGITFVELLH